MKKHFAKIIGWFRARRRMVLPFRTFHAVPLENPGAELIAQHDDVRLRAVMMVLEQHIGERLGRCLVESHQQVPGVAAHMAGAADSLMVFHEAVRNLVEGRTQWEK